MPHRSHSTQENPKNETHPWLEEKVYAHLRQRTVDLVKQSVDALLNMTGDERKGVVYCIKLSVILP